MATQYILKDNEDIYGSFNDLQECYYYLLQTLYIYSKNSDDENKDIYFKFRNFKIIYFSNCFVEKDTFVLNSEFDLINKTNIKVVSSESKILFFLDKLRKFKDNDEQIKVHVPDEGFTDNKAIYFDNLMDDSDNSDNEETDYKTIEYLEEIKQKRIEELDKINLTLKEEEEKKKKFNDDIYLNKKVLDEQKEEYEKKKVKFLEDRKTFFKIEETKKNNPNYIVPKEIFNQYEIIQQMNEKGELFLPNDECYEKFLEYNPNYIIPSMSFFEKIDLESIMENIKNTNIENDHLSINSDNDNDHNIIE